MGKYRFLGKGLNHRSLKLLGIGIGFAILYLIVVAISAELKKLLSRLRLKMSGPYDGHSFFSCFGNPFRFFAMGNSTDVSFKSRHDEALEAFETSLGDRLVQLHVIKPRRINWEWMQQVMEMICATHKDLNSFIADLQFPVNHVDSEWIIWCLGDRWKLHEICDLLHVENKNLYKFKVSIETVLHLLDLSGRVPQYDDVLLAKETLQDLTEKIKAGGESGESKTVSMFEKCLAILDRMSITLNLGKEQRSHKCKLFIRAMYGLMVIFIFVWSIFASALSGSVYSFGELNIPKQLVWSASFRDLQQEVNEDMKNGISRAFVLQELDDLDASVQSVLSVIQTSYSGILEGKCKTVHIPEGLEEVAHIREGVKKLRHSVETLSNLLGSLMIQINEAFPDCIELVFRPATETFENGSGLR